MPFPILPVVAGALLLGGLLLAKKNTSSGPTVAATGSADIPPGRGIYDANLPWSLEETVTKMLATDTNPADLQQLAQALIPTYPIAAKALNDRALSLGAPPLVHPAPSTPPPIQPPPIIQPPPVIVQPPPVDVAPPPPPPVQAPPIVLPPISSGGAVPSWDPSRMTLPKLPAIPAHYLGYSDETRGIQVALNNWIATTGAPYAQLATDANGLPDGSYGPETQKRVAAFQLWENAYYPSANLTVDGLAGPSTQTPLLDFGTFIPGTIHGGSAPLASSDGGGYNENVPGVTSPGFGQSPGTDPTAGIGAGQL